MPMFLTVLGNTQKISVRVEIRWNPIYEIVQALIPSTIFFLRKNFYEYGDQIRVRVNFQYKLIDNKGVVIKIEQVEDEKFYQEFFSKVDKSIFLCKEKV